MSMIASLLQTEYCECFFSLVCNNEKDALKVFVLLGRPFRWVFNFILNEIRLDSKFYKGLVIIYIFIYVLININHKLKPIFQRVITDKHKRLKL